MPAPARSPSAAKSSPRLHKCYSMCCSWFASALLLAFALGADASAAVDERRLTDAEGFASFSGLPAGAFDLAVEGAPSVARASRTVRVPDDDAVVEIVLPGP